MKIEDQLKRVRPWDTACYLIEVEGAVPDDWSDRLGGMRISRREREDGSVVSRLIGPLIDQSELSGVLNSLADRRLTILSVQILEKHDVPSPGAENPGSGTR
jgi:hypothetical protein